jgi:putative aldouronate transport system permease protein
MMVKYLKMKNTYTSLVFPLLMNVIYILIMKNFMKSIPDAIFESAKLDGAGDFTIFINLVLPLSKPALATIGLFIALNYWNDWYNAMLFIDKQELYPLQYFLYNILSKLDFINQSASRSGVPVPQMPSEPMKLAMTVVATGPIVLLYPFIQKYFVKGITIGAVKG